MDTSVLWIGVAADSVVLLVLFARAIGWKPRWRWEMELELDVLRRRVEILERRLEHRGNRVGSPEIVVAKLQTG